MECFRIVTLVRLEHNTPGVLFSYSGCVKGQSDDHLTHGLAVSGTHFFASIVFFVRLDHIMVVDEQSECLRFWKLRSVLALQYSAGLITCCSLTKIASVRGFEILEQCSSIARLGRLEHIMLRALFYFTRFVYWQSANHVTVVDGSSCIEIEVVP